MLIIISKASLISIILPRSIITKSQCQEKYIWSVQILSLIAFFQKLKIESAPREGTEYIWTNPKSPLQVIAKMMVHPHIYVKKWKKPQDFCFFKEF